MLLAASGRVPHDATLGRRNLIQMVQASVTRKFFKMTSGVAGVAPVAILTGRSNAFPPGAPESSPSRARLLHSEDFEDFEQRSSLPRGAAGS